MNQPHTQRLIDEARGSEYVMASHGDKADWIQFASTKTPDGRVIDVAVRSVGSKIAGTKITRSMFYRGRLHISRAKAEAMLTEGA